MNAVKHLYLIIPFKDIFKICEWSRQNQGYIFPKKLISITFDAELKHCPFVIVLALQFFCEMNEFMKFCAIIFKKDCCRHLKSRSIFINWCGSKTYLFFALPFLFFVHLRVQFRLATLPGEEPLKKLRKNRKNTLHAFWNFP